MHTRLASVTAESIAVWLGFLQNTIRVDDTVLLPKAKHVTLKSSLLAVELHRTRRLSHRGRNREVGSTVDEAKLWFELWLEPDDAGGVVAALPASKHASMKSL